MKLTDLAEIPPPPPPHPEKEEVPQVEAIAETMIETDIPPVQTIVAAGTIITPSIVAEPADDYLPMLLVSEPVKFDEREIAAALIYPPIALRSGIEGRVILELFVDRNGVVQQVRILQETPPDRGFGEAAVRAFSGRKGTPAIANGKTVSMRYRYPVTFRIK
jgi:protein TonB